MSSAAFFASQTIIVEYYEELCFSLVQLCCMLKLLSFFQDWALRTHSLVGLESRLGMKFGLDSTKSV